MTASADTAGLPVSVTVPITIKFQIYNETLKQCLLTEEQIANNSFFFQKINYIIKLDSGLPDFAAIFNKVGLIGLTSEDEKERVSYILYEPKNEYYSDMLFNNNKVQLKLRILQQAETTDIYNSPITLDETKYF